MALGQTVTPEIEAIILERLASGEEGNRSLRQVCKDPALPSRDTVNEHLKRTPAFAEAYAAAKVEGLEARFEQVTKLIEGESDVQKARLLWDNERWQLKTLLPKVYGDKVEIGGDLTIRHEDALKALE